MIGARATGRPSTGLLAEFELPDEHEETLGKGLLEDVGKLGAKFVSDKSTRFRVQLELMIALPFNTERLGPIEEFAALLHDTRVLSRIPRHQ